MINFALLLLSYGFMEFIAWSNHKYVMHGFLWSWHKDHHINDRKKSALEELKFSGFEKNDLFFLVYALPAIVLLIIGLYIKNSQCVFIGIGISLYGFTYFMVHDVMIHQRLHFSFLIKNKGKYFQAIKRAHLAHHRPGNKNDFNNFGLLIFPLHFFKS